MLQPERHCVWGLRKVVLHALMSVLAIKFMALTLLRRIG